MSPLLGDETSCVIENKMSGLQIDLSVLSPEDGTGAPDSPSIVSLLTPTSPPVCCDVTSVFSSGMTVSFVFSSKQTNKQTNKLTNNNHLLETNYSESQPISIKTERQCVSHEEIKELEQRCYSSLPTLSQAV